jgi:hypothetical protein
MATAGMLGKSADFASFSLTGMPMVRPLSSAESLGF